MKVKEIKGLAKRNNEGGLKILKRLGIEVHFTTR
jgi:hypothetical protein